MRVLVGIVLGTTLLVASHGVGRAAEPSVDERIETAAAAITAVEKGTMTHEAFVAGLVPIAAAGRFDEATRLLRELWYQPKQRDPKLRGQLEGDLARLFAQRKTPAAQVTSWRRGIALWVALGFYAKQGNRVTVAPIVTFVDAGVPANGQPLSQTTKQRLGPTHALFTDLDERSSRLVGLPTECTATCCAFEVGGGVGDAADWRIARVCWDGKGAVTRIERKSN